MMRLGGEGLLKGGGGGRYLCFLTNSDTMNRMNVQPRQWFCHGFALYEWHSQMNPWQNHCKIWMAVMLQWRFNYSEFNSFSFTLSSLVLREPRCESHLLRESEWVRESESEGCVLCVHLSSFSWMKFRNVSFDFYSFIDLSPAVRRIVLYYVFSYYPQHSSIPTYVGIHEWAISKRFFWLLRNLSEFPSESPKFFLNV